MKADAESTRDVGELEEDIKQRQKILDACKKTINDMENNEKIVQRIKDCWENAIPYRRAAHEQTAMVREISLRCSWTLPIRPDRNADWEYLHPAEDILMISSANYIAYQKSHEYDQNVLPEAEREVSGHLNNIFDMQVTLYFRFAYETLSIVVVLVAVFLFVLSLFHPTLVD